MNRKETRLAGPLLEGHVVSSCPLGAHDVRRVAVAATCGEQTVRRFLRGEAVKSVTHARISRALAALGFTEPRTEEQKILRLAASGLDAEAAAEFVALVRAQLAKGRA